jgi:hypothetical protein
MVSFFMATSWGAFSCALSGDACEGVGDEATGAEAVGRSKKNSPAKPTRRIGIRINALRTGFTFLKPQFLRDKGTVSVGSIS